jgi:hypothetical protein
MRLRRRWPNVPPAGRHPVPPDAHPSRTRAPTVEDPGDHAAAGLTVKDLARRYRIGEDKVRTFIARGELKAINTAAVLCGRPRWVVPVEALAEFEQRRASGPPPKPRRRHRRTTAAVYYPD